MNHCDVTRQIDAGLARMEREYREDMLVEPMETWRDELKKIRQSVVIEPVSYPAIDDLLDALDEAIGACEKSISQALNPPTE